MANCPECTTKLVRQATVTYRDDGYARQVGSHYFCPNQDCDYERDIIAK